MSENVIAPSEGAARRAGRPAHPLLSVPGIAAAALELLDETGDVTMQQLARRLDVRPSALYNHVAGKDEVLARVRDLVSERIEVDVFDELPLFDALHTWAWSYRDAFAAHPSTIAVFATMALAGARRTTEMYDRVVRAFLGAGWPEGDVLVSLVALEDFILGAALDAAAPANMFDRNESTDASAFASVITARKAAHPDRRPADVAFDAGLDVLLAGLRIRLERIRGA